MNLAKTSYYKIASLLPMSIARAMGSFTTLLPYHHTVSNDFLPHIKYLFNYKNVAQFSADLDFLLKHYKPVTQAQVLQSISQHNALPKKSFLLSFDDGFREVHDVVAPILERKGIPAYFFINPAFIDNKTLFYRCKISLLLHEFINRNDANATKKIFNEELKTAGNSFNEINAALKKIHQGNAGVLDTIAAKIGFSFDNFLKTQQPFLTSGQLASLHGRGFYIGAHSMTHPYYNMLPLQEQIQQTALSCSFVQEITKAGKCSFSFPHTDVGIAQHFFDELANDVPLFFGIQNQKEELHNKMLHRFNAERPEVDFAAQIKGLSLMMWLQNLTGKNRVTRN